MATGQPAALRGRRTGLLILEIVIRVAGRFVGLVAVDLLGGIQVRERLDRRRGRSESVRLRGGQPIVRQREVPSRLVVEVVGPVRGVGRGASVGGPARTAAVGILIGQRRIRRYGRVAVLRESCVRRLPGRVPPFLPLVGRLRSRGPRRRPVGSSLRVHRGERIGSRGEIRLEVIVGVPIGLLPGRRRLLPGRLSPRRGRLSPRRCRRLCRRCLLPRHRVLIGRTLAGIMAGSGTATGAGPAVVRHAAPAVLRACRRVRLLPLQQACRGHRSPQVAPPIPQGGTMFSPVRARSGCLQRKPRPTASVAIELDIDHPPSQPITRKLHTGVIYAGRGYHRAWRARGTEVAGSTGSGPGPRRSPDRRGRCGRQPGGSAAAPGTVPTASGRSALSGDGMLRPDRGRRDGGDRMAAR